MSKTLPDFVSDDAPSMPAEAPAAEITAEAAPAAESPPEAAPAAEGQPRGPDGKFAPSQPAPALEAQAAPAAPAEAAPALEAPPALAPAPAQPPAEPGYVPLAVVLDEREKRQAAERDARELREWRAQQEARTTQTPAPDPDQDPAGFRAFQSQQLDQVFWENRLEMSRGFAEMRHGPETTQAAFQWGVERCDQDPFFNAKVRSSKDPVGFVVAEWQQQQLISEMTPEDIASFRTWKAAQAAPQPALAAAQPALQPAAAPAAPPPAPAAPRPSLAAAPSAARSGAPIPRDGEETYRAQFG